DLGRLLDVLCTTSEQRQGLLNRSGGLEEGVVVLLNGHHIALVGGVNATLHEGDEVAIFPPIAGG
ncbi:MAG: MoaD/ThiS family protein, partial [bacterium]